jgi:beta-glucosidase
MQRRSRLALSPVALALLASLASGCFSVTQDKSKGKSADAGALCTVSDAGIDASVDGSAGAEGGIADLATCSAYCPQPRPSMTTPVDRSVESLVSQLSLDEKIQTVSGASSCDWGVWTSDFNSTGVPQRGIPDWRMSDGPRGVHILSGGKATTWAVAEARAATFDTDLERRVGRFQGYEMKALKYNVSLAPTINTLRHPLWARAQETYGEDPVLQGEMGAAFVLGMQESVVACPKHLVGNDTDDNRMNVIAHMDEQTLRENYLLPFQIVVEKADPGCMMAAYNGVKGTPSSIWYQGASQGWCTENDYVMTQVPRREWQWNGVMISDWWATKYHADLSMNGGLDLEMPDNCAYTSLPGVVPNKVPMERIDEAVLRILNVRTKFKQIEADTRKPDRSLVDDQTHKDLARETAEKGAVLLKNENILPLNKVVGDAGSPNVKSIVFLGPDSDLPNVARNVPDNASGLGDRGSSGTNAPYTISFVQGMQEKGFTVTESPNPADAAKADIAIIPVSMAHEDEGEHYDNGHDRIDLTLSVNHPKHWFAAGLVPSAFIKQAVAANPKTIVLLLVGSAVVMEDWIDSVPAIVQTFYPGQEGGRALAKLLTGEINFSGKLPFTVGKNEADYPGFDNKASKTDVDYWHGYRRFEHPPSSPVRFWFGFGKSYTTFEYSNPRVLCSSGITDTGQLTVQVDVKNTGLVEGVEAVQLYIGGYPAGPRRPVKELKAFARATSPADPTKGLAPGETTTVTLSVAAKDMAYWDMDTHSWIVQKGQHTVFVGPSADPATLKSATFTITPSTSGAP